MSWLCLQTDGTAADAVVPRWEVGRQPLHASYRRTAVKGTREAVVPDAGLHAVLDALDAVDDVGPRSWPGEFERSFADVDTAEDLADVGNEASNERSC